MRHNILAALFLLAFAPLSYGQNIPHLKKIQQSVIDFLKKGAGSPAGCNLFKDLFEKDRLNAQKRKMISGFCDSNIDFSKPISFAEMYTHQVDGHSYVCGVISGETKLNRKTGVRFISAEPYHLILSVKFSRRPIAYASDDSFLADEYRSQIKSFNELNRKYCK